MARHPRSPRSKCTSGEPYLASYTKKWSNTEDTKVMQATEKGNIWGGGHYLHIQYSTPTELATFTRKRHLNSDLTAHKSLYHLQKGLDGTSIQTIPPERYKWRVEMQWEELYKARKSSKKVDAHLTHKKKWARENWNSL